jgi:hypothetical protein
MAETPEEYWARVVSIFSARDVPASRTIEDTARLLFKLYGDVRVDEERTGQISESHAELLEAIGNDLKELAAVQRHAEATG